MLGKLKSEFRVFLFDFLCAFSVLTSVSWFVHPGVMLLMGWDEKSFKGIGLSFVLLLLLACGYAFLRSLYRQNIKAISMVGGHNVYIRFGDVFDEKIVHASSSRRIVVIPVNQCFDIMADDTVIARSSLHGQGVEKACEWKGVLQTALQDEVNAYLNKNLQVQVHAREIETPEGLLSVQEVVPPYKMLTEKEKKLGSRKRYAPGTVVPVKLNKDCTFYFMALSYLRGDYRAELDIDSFDKILRKLVDYIDVHANGCPVVLPVLGTGFTRLGKSEDQILHMLVNKLYVYGDSIQSDIYIVASEVLREKLNVGRYL